MITSSVRMKLRFDENRHFFGNTSSGTCLIPLYFVMRIIAAHRLFHQLFHKENKVLWKIPGKETFFHGFSYFFEYLAQRAHGPRDAKSRRFLENSVNFKEICQWILQKNMFYVFCKKVDMHTSRPVRVRFSRQSAT